MVYVTYQNKRVKLPVDQNGNAIQGAIPYTGGVTTTAVSSGSATTATAIVDKPYTGGPQLVLVSTVNDGFLKFGGSSVAATVPTAGTAAEGMYLPAGSSILIALRPEDTHWSCIWLTSGNFTCYVTPIGEYNGSMG